jgi:transposase
MKNFTLIHFNPIIYKKQIPDTNFFRTRATLINQKNSINDKNKESQFKLPKHSLDCAIKDVCGNLKASLKLHHYDTGKFRLRYIKKTNKNKVIRIEKSEISNYDYEIKQMILRKNLYEDLMIPNDNKIYFRKLGILHCISSVPLITSDCTIFTKNNRYFINIPQYIKNDQIKIKKYNTIKSTLLYDHNNKPKRCVNIDNKNIIKTIGIDLGIRTFLTGYSNSGTIEIGSNIKDTIYPILEKIDNMKSVLKDVKCKKRQKIRKGIRKRWRLIKNKIKELHDKTILKLVQNYDNIIIGNISTKNIISSIRKKGILNAINKRLIQSISLYKFKEKLRQKCDLYNKKYGEINEAYTSKTCSNCGNVRMTNNKTKVYKCLKCKTIMDRDINAAKNIYILGTIY